MLWHLCSCFDGRGRDDSSAKNFQRALGSSPSTAAIVPLGTTDTTDTLAALAARLDEHAGLCARVRSSSERLRNIRASGVLHSH